MIDNQSLKLFGSTVNVATSKERNWRDTLRKAAKVLSVCYCAVVMLSLLLPDAFVLCLSEEEALTNSGGWHAVLRTALAACFVVLPLSAFYKNKTLNNCCFVVIVVAVIAAVEYPTFMSYFTDPRGRGINSMSVINDNVKAFLLRKDFRTVVFFASVALMLSAAICSLIAYGEKHDLKDKEEYMFLWVFPLIMLLALPIYVPQHIIGYTDMIFKPFSIAHFLWITATVGEIAVLYVILRRKDTQTQNIVLLALSLALLLQFNQLFGAVSISFKRLPLQLCNIGSFLILASLISKNKKIFNFTLIINVAGALFAYAVPDVDGKGIGYLYNMHFILEHTGVVVIPLLCLLLGFIDKPDKNALKDCLKGFCIYFASVWALGTIFNAVAAKTANGFYSANYLFMFDKNAAVKLLPFLGQVFDVKISIGNFIIYPAIQAIVFAVFVVVCVGVYFVLKLSFGKKQAEVVKNHADVQDVNGL